MYRVRPKVGLPMVRLGRLFDGGYVLPKVVLDRCENLISLGYGYDSSFERDFLKISKINRVTLYDSTINLLGGIKNLIKSCFQFIQGQNAYPPYRAKQLLEYILLLVNPRIKYKVEFVSQKSSEKSKGIDEILSQTVRSNSILKMDIEGSEYGLFNNDSLNLLKLNVKFLSAEFHLENEDRKTKFRNFRDNVLSTFKNYQVYSINGVDIKWDLYNEHFLQYYNEVMIHIEI
jgi:hypothetical protein